MQVALFVHSYFAHRTQYSELSEFLVGSDLVGPPMLVWTDYVTVR